MKFEVRMNLSGRMAVNIHFIMNDNIYAGFDRGDIQISGWFCVLIKMRGY